MKIAGKFWCHFRHSFVWDIFIILTFHWTNEPVENGHHVMQLSSIGCIRSSIKRILFITLLFSLPVLWQTNYCLHSQHKLFLNPNDQWYLALLTANSQYINITKYISITTKPNISHQDLLSQLRKSEKKFKKKCSFNYFPPDGPVNFT